MNDVIERLRATGELFAREVAGLRAEDWTRRGAEGGWTVQEIVDGRPGPARVVVMALD